MNQPQTTESIPSPGQTTLGSAEEPPPTEIDTPSISETPGWGGTGEEEEIIISTDDYRAVFSTRGGTLKSWQLPNFENPVGAPVELVLGSRELGITLVGNGASHLDDVIYDVRRETAATGDRRLVFTAGSGTQQVVKTFTLPREGFLGRLEVELRGFEDASGYRVTWKDGIPRAEENKRQYDQ